MQWDLPAQLPIQWCLPSTAVYCKWGTTGSCTRDWAIQRWLQPSPSPSGNTSNRCVSLRRCPEAHQPQLTTLSAQLLVSVWMPLEYVHLKRWMDHKYSRAYFWAQTCTHTDTHMHTRTNTQTATQREVQRSNCLAAASCVIDSITYMSQLPWVTRKLLYINIFGNEWMWQGTRLCVCVWTEFWGSGSWRTSDRANYSCHPTAHIRSLISSEDCHLG